MSVDHELFETVRHPLRMRRLHVTRVERPTPRLARVTLAGDDLDGFRSDGPGDHVKVFFPAPGEDEPWLPQLGPAGIVPTPGAPRPIARDYTPKHQSLGERVLQLDIVLHDGGMASGWAAHAEPGRVLGVAGPRGSHVLRPGVAGLVLVGDETALPAIQNFLHGAAPGLPVLAIVEVQDEQDVQPLESAADVTARWVFRRDVAPGHGTALVDELAAATLPTGRVLHWAAAETAITQSIRMHLVQQRQIDPALVHTRGYWKLGASDHQEPHDD